MYKVFVGNISPEGEHLLTSYLNVFMPDAKIEPLKAVGIKTKIKVHGKKADCALIILDESLYQSCVGTCDDVLSMPKVHKYVTDDGLNEFLISKFGKLDGSSLEEKVVVPPDVLLQQQAEEPVDEIVVPSPDIFPDSDETLPTPDQILSGNLGIVNSVVEDTEENLAISDEYTTEQENNDALINELRDKLARSEMLVKNLTLQLEDKGADDDTEAFINRIKELEGIIEEKDKALAEANNDSYIQLGKVARADQVINEVNDLKDEIKRVKEDKSAVIYERDKYKNEVDLLNTQIEDLKTKVVQIDVLRQEVSDKSSEIESLKSDLEAKVAELTSVSEQTSGVETTLDAVKADLETLQTSYDSVKAELESSQTKVAELTESIQSKDFELEELKNNLADQTGDLSEELKTARETIDSLNSDIDKKTKELEDAMNLYDEASQSNDTLQKEIDERAGEVNTLTTELKSSKEEIESLSAKLTAVESEKSDLTATVGELTTEKGEIERERLELESRVDELTNSLEESRDEALEFEDKLKELNTLKEEIEALQVDVKSKDSELEKVRGSLDLLRTENDDLTDHIKKLTRSIGSSDSVSSEEVSKLQADLDDERKKSAQLESELEVLKNNSDDSNKSTELRLEVAKLRNELDKTKKELSDAKSEANTDEIDVLKNELVESRKRCGDLEIEIEEQTSTLEEVTSSVFGQMANIAMPKVPYDLNITNINGSLPNFICIASGSDESSGVVYSTLKRACVTNATKHVLIVDLVTDSTIDREFGISKVVSPINWLNGSDSFKNFLAVTRVNNVRVLSTALAYLNDLYLLTIDWQKRLDELNGFADTVVINIGCLNNLVTKVLFNAFSKVMKTYVITKATPINLRTVMLNLTGIKNISPNVTVECVNFDERASRAMYQRLVAKYKAQILKDSDVLVL